jgi:hypothetical protein
LSSSLNGFNPHGLSQGGGQELVSNSFSKFQNLDFEILGSPFQFSTALDDNFGHNSISGRTDFLFVESASKTTVSDHLKSSVQSTMASSPGHGSVDDKLDKMMAFLQTTQVVNIHAVANDHIFSRQRSNQKFSLFIYYWDPRHL